MEYKGRHYFVWLVHTPAHIALMRALVSNKSQVLLISHQILHVTYKLYTGLMYFSFHAQLMLHLSFSHVVVVVVVDINSPNVGTPRLRVEQFS